MGARHNGSLIGDATRNKIRVPLTVMVTGPEFDQSYDRIEPAPEGAISATVAHLVGMKLAGVKLKGRFRFACMGKKLELGF